jgi:glutamate formiminotransferase
MQTSEAQSSASPPLIECVPNFSEGRDARKIDEIIMAILNGFEVFLLHQTMDTDHNRSVITFAGTEQGVRAAALRGIGRAVDLIDINRHEGVHPRIGVADVVPFVPLDGARMEDCIQVARWVAEKTARRFGVPTYLYEAAAYREDRRNLEIVRRGQFEMLRERIRTDPERMPDFGEPELHPTAGATALGARGLLVAFNINLASADVTTAKAIARKIRTSSGGLPAVKALGFYLPSRSLAQVSINLTDFQVTPLAVVFEAVREEAQRLGVAVLETEIIGLIPSAALQGCNVTELKIRDFCADRILENRLARVLGSSS